MKGTETLGAPDPRPSPPPDSLFLDRPALFTHRWGVEADAEAAAYPVVGPEVYARLPDAARACVTYFDGEVVVCRCGKVTIGPLRRLT